MSLTLYFFPAVFGHCGAVLYDRREDVCGLCPVGYWSVLAALLHILAACKSPASSESARQETRSLAVDP